MNPTDQQVEAIALFRLGLTLCLKAGAGTGKTSTLVEMAKSTRRIGQYTAFNRDVVIDAAAKFPDNVACATAHSLAFRAVGRRYAHRLESKRMRSADVARQLRLSHLPVRLRMGEKVLQPGYLAGLVQRAITNFCQTADPVPAPGHVPYVDGIDDPEAEGRHGWTNNLRVREHVAPALERAWADITNEAGVLRFSPDHYFKMWQLGEPRIPGDFLLVDEAQDLSPVMLDVVTRQDSQLVVIGDANQQIYGWRGAVNALDQVPTEATAVLSKSFRFGQQIADVANAVLEELGADLRLEGSGASRVGACDDPSAVLCRTNAEAVRTVLAYQAAGTRVHLVGGGREVAAFAKGVQELEEGAWTSHPELACFRSLAEVRQYVEQDPQGSELKLLVDLVDKFGVDTILAALDHMPEQDAADAVVSTAHKSKGREWSRVQLAGDYVLPDGGVAAVLDEEWRLVYVAATRARGVLDARRCEPLQALLEPAEARLPIALPPVQVEDLDDELDLVPDPPEPPLTRDEAEVEDGARAW